MRANILANLQLPILTFIASVAVASPPIISSISPTAGPVPSTKISVTGTGFTKSATAKFGSNPSALTYTYVSSTSATVQIPATITSTIGPISITTGSGTATSPVPFVVAPTSNSPAAANTTATTDTSCTAIEPFYWEIGDQYNTLVSGSSPMGGSITSSYPMSIASASKMVYAAYVVQLRGGVSGLVTPNLNEVPFMNFTSGYTNMPDASMTGGNICPSNDTITGCLSANPSYAAKNSANVGKFYYNAGHMENDANLNTALGPDGVTKIATAVQSELNLQTSFTYTEPLVTGGMYGVSSDYALFLRAVLSGTLYMNQALGTSPVCTLPQSKNCNAVSSPIPLAWHYSIGHWVEDNPQTTIGTTVYPAGDGAFSSPGEYGFYPWIEKSKQFYGLIARQSSAGQQGFVSAQCGQKIRAAWDSGNTE